MRILIIGTGVIGAIYGWQLTESGNAVTHYVRPGQKEAIDRQGLLIRCQDMRKKANNGMCELIYRPNVTEDVKGAYDLIIVPVKATQLESVLPILTSADERTDILFLQNLWHCHLQKIDDCLPDSRIVYGQPHITGGGKEGNIITCTIFNVKNASTMLGKKSGKKTRQVVRIAQVMDEAGLNPCISRNITAWLLTHFAEANGLVAGVMEAGSAAKFVTSKEYMRHSVQIIREGFRVCAALKAQAWKIYPQVLYYSPIRILLFALLKMYRTQESQRMIQGHISHSPDEMKEMFYTVLHTGELLKVHMVQYRNAQGFVDKFCR